MKNHEAAAALRDLASRIDRLDPEQDLFRIQLHAHNLRDKQKLLDAMSVRDHGCAIGQACSDGTHWADFKVNGVEVTAYFDPAILGETITVKQVVTKTTAGRVSDLLAENEATEATP